MKRISWIELFLTFTVNVLVIAEEGNEKVEICKLCTCAKRRNDAEDEVIWLNCISKSLQTIPTEVSWPEAEIYSLDLHDNKITKIKEFMTVHENLVYLHLDYNQIKYVDSNVFKNLEDLEELYLSRNKIGDLNINAFDGLVLLSILDLSFNQLRSLPSNIFKQLTGLLKLDISGNPLKVIHHEVMRPLTALKSIRAAEIRCSSLSDNVFNCQSDLEVVDLSGNDFKKIPTRALQIYHPETKNIGILELDMSDNPIEVLTADSFSGLRKLDTLILSEMEELRTIEKHTFSDLKNLRTLKISACPKLRNIDEQAFTGLFNKSDTDAQLTIHLNGNSLSTLPEKLLPWENLRSVQLQGNPFNCDCSMRWLGKIKDKLGRRLSVDRCSGPASVVGLEMIDLPESKYVCEVKKGSKIQKPSEHTTGIVWGITVTVVSVLCISIVVYVFRKRSSRFRDGSGQHQGVIKYRKAHTQPDFLEPVDL